MAPGLYRMQISDEHLDDLIERWKHAFGETLTRAEAQHQGSKLIELYRIIARPLPGSATPPSDPPADQNSSEAS